MCEIAVIDPELVPIETVHSLAERFHEEQGDGVGVVAVVNEGDRFTYPVYKSTSPHWQTLYSFLRRNYDDAWRFVVHGRSMTSGKRNRDTTHPIEIDCDLCDFDYVVHNGSVRNDQTVRERMFDEGHHFNTLVDTEIIPHEVGQLPEDLDDVSGSTYRIYGNLSYLLFAEDGILARVEQKYHLSGDFTLTCSYDRIETPNELGFASDNTLEWMLVTPNGRVPEIETKDRAVYTRQTTGTYRTSKYSTSNNPQDRRDKRSGVPGRAGQWGNDDPEKYTIEYEDLSNYEWITAIQVAPGVIKLIDTNEGETAFVFRNENPKLYYWYSKDEEPDNIDDPGEVSTDEIVDAAVAGVERALSDNIDDVSIEDVAQIEDEIIEIVGA